MTEATTQRFDELEIRRAIMKTTTGGTSAVPVPIGQEEAAANRAMAFARSRSIRVVVTQEYGRIGIHKLAPDEKPEIYPVLDALMVGESHTFPFPPSLHPRVRSAATARNRTGLVSFACHKEGDHIRVTRMPMTEAEAASLTLDIKPRSDTGKYMLSRFLVPGAKAVYNLPKAQHYALRNSVSRYATVNNLRLRCRLQDDGTLLVYRVD